MNAFDPKSGLHVPLGSIVDLGEYRALRILAEEERRKVEQVREIVRKEQTAFQRDYGDESDAVNGTIDEV